MKPKVFVGSSTEALEVARALQEELEFDAELTIWSQNVFQAGSSAIESLQSALLKFDFAVFILSPDDQIESRGTTLPGPRDNVIFELGLFTGRLGRERVFFLSPRTAAPNRVLTDLVGIAPLTFDPTRSDANLRAALGPAANQLRRAFQKIESHHSRCAPSLAGAEPVPTPQIKAEIEAAASRAVTISGDSGHSATIVFFDVDGFTAINKWFGDEIGNRVIETVHELLKQDLHAHFWTRFGGDQFVACLAGLPPSQSRILAATIVHSVMERDWSSLAPGLYVGMSGGVAVSQPHEAVGDWVVRAIHGSILAKKRGGGRVEEAPLRLGRGISRAWTDYTS